ncbi:MAG TPA: ATP-binding cassette domain-containing protein [Acidimicrobiales bacterium]|nr:ATP-binding cassette domain-containing protein [Acidimicrobiales bacterium]
MGDVAIRAEGLVKRFGELTALAGVDFEVPTGTVFGLLGPNGAGKTTAVRLLTTALRPDGGRAEVEGIDVATNPKEVRRRIGLAGQFAAVDESLTGRENLILVGRLTHQPKKEQAARAGELLERFGLEDAGDRLVRTYSGGMRRRLDLAAALVHRPRVLFLDEPTTGLDPRSRVDLWKMIEELVAEGTTLLLTTQYLEEADQLADYICLIDHGRVVAEGTAAELKAQLSGTTLHFEFATKTQARRARAKLAELGSVGPDGGELSVEVGVNDSGPALLEAVRTLDKARLTPVSVAAREPSLDDVFLTLTGQPLDTDEQSEEVAR